MKMIRFSLLFVALSFTVGFKPVVPGNNSFSSMDDLHLDYETKEILDLSYYENELDSDLTKINLVLPVGAKNPPVFLWLGGGAWAYVDRHREMDFARKVAATGIAMAVAGHRLSPALLREPVREEGVRHPEHIKDVAQAFRWVYDHAEEYGYAQDQIFVGGYSCGAHLSTLLALDLSYLEGVGLSNDHIKAVIPVAGGYDIPQYREVLTGADPKFEDTHFIPVFGDTMDDYIQASPTNYLHNLKVPMLIISEADTYGYTKFFVDKIRETDFRDFQVMDVFSESHASLSQALSQSENSVYRSLIVNYIYQHATENGARAKNK